MKQTPRRNPASMDRTVLASRCIVLQDAVLRGFEMKAWPRHPLIYEINTWVWLGALSRRYQKPINFATIPNHEWDAIATFGFDVVWFMGVWERSPAGIEISMRNDGLLQ